MNNYLKRKHENHDDHSNKYLRELMKSNENMRSLERRKLQKNGFNLDEISSFFESFDNWEMLPTEIKCMIIRELDFVTRFSLSSCSKSMKQIVEIVPLNIKSINVRGGLGRGSAIVFTLITQPGLQQNEVTISFERSSSQKGGGFISRKWFEERLDTSGIRAIENRKRYNYTDYASEMVSFVKNTLKLARYQVDELKVCVIDWGDNPSFEILDKLQVKKKLMVLASDENLLVRWLDIAKSPLEKLEIIFSSNGNIKEIFEHETITNAKRLIINGNISITESYFLNLKFKKISISGGSSGVIDEQINAFVKRWIDGGGPNNFKIAHFRRNHGSETSEILNNLEYLKWDDEFKRENTTLCEFINLEYCFKKRCYYIESEKRNNGATLILNSHNFIFLVTGKRRTKSD